MQPFKKPQSSDSIPFIGNQAEGGRRPGGITTVIPRHLNQQTIAMYLQFIHVQGVATMHFLAPLGQQKAKADLFMHPWLRQRLGGLSLVSSW